MGFIAFLRKYKVPIPQRELFEVEEGTSTLDGNNTGTVRFSTTISEIFLLNLTDTDDLKFKEINEANESAHWKTLPKGLKWASLAVPDDTIKLSVKHTTTAQDFEVWGSRFRLRGWYK